MFSLFDNIRPFLLLYSALVQIMRLPVTSTNPDSTLPELKNGDIVLFQPYPYRTIPDASRTVFQISRLGYDSIRDFQKKQNLVVDNIVGLNTRKQAEELYTKHFSNTPRVDKKFASLFLSNEMLVANDTSFVILTLKNVGNEKIRLLGTVTYDLRGKVTFADPYIAISTWVSSRNGNLVACGPGPSAFVEFAKDFEIAEGSSIKRKVEMPKLGDNQHGVLHVEVEYLDSNLSVFRLKTESVEIPKLMK